MNKYNSEDYFSVVEKRTGRKIADCGDISDARMLLHMDPQNRQIVKKKFLMDIVVDVEVQKQLPTTGIQIDSNAYKEHQENWIIERLNALSEGTGEPVIVS